jgi:peptidoglycan/LPS O-acetylase OafA/YrhL
VLAFHFNVPGAHAAGRTGVTLFLVLSGYLISAHLLASRRGTGFTPFLAFYRRRALRIGPALLVLLAISGVAALLTGTGGEMAPAIAATIFQVADAPDVLGLDLHWLSHMWTLSLEAQFYLVIPLVIAASFASPILVTLEALLIAAAALLYAPVAALAVGAALASLGAHPRSWFGIRAIAILGVGVLLTSVAIDNQSSYYNLVPTLGTSVGAAMLIAAAAGARTSLRLPGLRRVGVISYSLYLWHLPVAALVYPALYGAGQPWWLATAASLGLSLAAGSASYRYIERPVLRRKTALRARPVGAVVGSPA